MSSENEHIKASAKLAGREVEQHDPWGGVSQNLHEQMRAALQTAPIRNLKDSGQALAESSADQWHDWLFFKPVFPPEELNSAKSMSDIGVDNMKGITNISFPLGTVRIDDK